VGITTSRLTLPPAEQLSAVSMESGAALLPPVLLPRGAHPVPLLQLKRKTVALRDLLPCALFITLE